jgi:cystathionine beta-synthase
MSSLPPPASSVLDLIGNTPLVKIRNLDTGPCELFLKLENQNPGGSIKDRIGRAMIEAAERDGRIGPGSVLVEATAGNTGLGLALVAAHKGYRLILVIPDKMSQEKINHLRALGAEVILTRSDVVRGHPQYYQTLAEQIARETPRAWYVNQFDNPANALAHETTTGPEIWEQTGHGLDAVVCGVGSGGTITGLGRYFARVAPQVELVLADPVGSVLADYVEHDRVGEAGSWLVEGIGEDFIPPLAELSRVHKAYRIGDDESFATARAVLLREGILAGSSSGTLIAAALRWCRAQTTPRRVVTFVCDSGAKYLSKMYNDAWLYDQGVANRPRAGDITDLISRRFGDGDVVAVAEYDLVSLAYKRMRMYDVSQLPVVSGRRIVGILDESDLLLAVHDHRDGFSRTVGDIMSRNLDTLPRTASLEQVVERLRAGKVAIIADHGGFHGIITQVDVVNYLRHRYRSEAEQAITTSTRTGA